MELNILYEDNYIIVIKKPAGIATQSANISQKDCVSLIKEHLKRNDKTIKGEPYVGVIHRLDQPVSGVLVFAKESKSAAILSKQVQGDIMSKNYHALVEGVLEDELEITLDNYIYKDSKLNKAVITKDKNNSLAKSATLKYIVENIDRDNGTSLLKISLITGRFHQIRAQLSYLGHPILGDRKYGSDRACPTDFLYGVTGMKGTIALVADRLVFTHPVNKKEMIFTWE